VLERGCKGVELKKRAESDWGCYSPGEGSHLRDCKRRNAESLFTANQTRGSFRGMIAVVSSTGSQSRCTQYEK